MAGIDKQQARNRLVVCVFAALCTGFILAMALGAFHGRNVNEDMKDLPDWVANSIAIGSVFISGVAVYLVAETLSATRETLDATRIMAADQRQMTKDQARIGDAQIRPWLLLDSHGTNGNGLGFHLSLVFKNFGNTPATNVTLYLQTEAYDFEEIDEGNGFRYKIHEGNRRSKYKSAIGPNSDFSDQWSFALEDFQLESSDIEISIEWNYQNHDKTMAYTQYATAVVGMKEYGGLFIRHMRH